MTYFNLEKESATELQTNGVSRNTNNSNVFSEKNPAIRAKDLLVLHHAIPNGINFEVANEICLECVEEILEHWLPEGEYQGREYKAHNPTRSDTHLGSFSINTLTGKWADFATGDKGGDLVSLISYIEGGIPQTASATKLLEFVAGIKVVTTSHSEERRAKRKNVQQSQFTPVMPIPADAKERPVFFGGYLGRPSMTWEYRDMMGRPLLYVLRFQTPDGKTYRPLTYCADNTGYCSWQLQGLEASRPLYGIDRLAARAGVPVLFAEGEKSADAAQRLFPDYVAVTTMHGSQSPHLSDFSPLSGRQIFIAPDNDEAGIRYKDALIRLLGEAGAEVVAVMRLGLLANAGAQLASGYDLADAEADGWTPEKLANLGSTLWEKITCPSTSIPEPTSSTDNKKETSEGRCRKKTALDYAEQFAASYGGRLAWVNNQLIAYADGHWSPLDIDSEVKRPILLVLGEEASASRINGIVDLIKIKYASKPDSFERQSPLICLNNCTLNPVTGEAQTHSPDHRLTNKLAIPYDREAKCPLWLQTLNGVFKPDDDSIEKIQLLQEYIGYCLIPDTRFQKFLWLVGSGGNGKSLILAIVTALVGKQNISYAQIERLQEKFVRAELQGKLVNISSEMSAQATVADGYLKQITAGDTIEAERKNERPFSFKPYCRLIGATNVLPRLLDHSDGFFRRAMILRFNRQFTEAEQDTQLEKKLMGELPGILNWAVEGLQRLLQRSTFVIPRSSKAEAEMYRVNSDPVRQFAEQFLVQTDEKTLWVQSSALYDRYREWSNCNGYKSLASNQFAERLSAIGIGRQKRNNGRYWTAEYRDSSMLHSPLPACTSVISAKYDV